VLAQADKTPLLLVNKMGKGQAILLKLHGSSSQGG